VTPGYLGAANGFGTVFNTPVGQSNAGLQWTGHPDSKWGGAVQASLQIKNLPTGAGDDFKVDASYGDGATKYVLGTSANLPGSFYLWSAGPTGTQGKFASGTITDGIYGGTAGTGFGAANVPLQLTQAYGIRAAFNHNWDPYWSSTLFGSASWVHYNATAIAAYCATFAAVALTGGVAGEGPGYHCDPGFSVFQVGGTTRWTPVKNLTFSGEVMYTYLHTNSSGQFTSGFSSTFPVTNTALPTQYGSQGVVTVNFRAQRNF
jgi:Porin subfamily